MPNDFWVEFFRLLPGYIGAISISIGGVVLVYKKISNFLKEHNVVVDKVQLIAEEMKPNGGTSMRDAINRIEHEVTLSNERYKALIADDKNAMFETDVNGSCIWVNRTYSRLTERTPSSLLGHGWVNAIAKGDRDRVTQAWKDSITEDREYVDEFSFQTPSGEKIPATVHSYKMTARNGDTLGYLGVCQIVDK